MVEGREPVATKRLKFSRVQAGHTQLRTTGSCRISSSVTALLAGLPLIGGCMLPLRSTYHGPKQARLLQQPAHHAAHTVCNPFCEASAALAVTVWIQRKFERRSRPNFGRSGLCCAPRIILAQPSAFISNSSHGRRKRTEVCHCTCPRSG